MFENYFTQNLKENEHLIDVLHRHWAGFVVPLVELLALAILPLFGFRYILSSQYAVLAYLIFLGILLVVGLYKWIVWYFDVFIITDARIIDIEQRSLFHREVREAATSRIQDVTYTVEGFLATLLNYGTVTVHTAASEGGLKLKKIPDPEGAQEIIIELQKLAKSDTALTPEEFVSYIANLKKGAHAIPDEAESQEPDIQPKKRRRQV